MDNMPDCYMTSRGIVPMTKRRLVWMTPGLTKVSERKRQDMLYLLNTGLVQDTRYHQRMHLARTGVTKGITISWGCARMLGGM